MGIMLVMVGAIALAGCSRGDKREEAFAAYADTPAQVGVGMGDLRLGQTTLKEVATKFGVGRPALLAGDDAGIELNYLDFQISLLFMVPSECRNVLRPDSLKAIESVANNVPACGNATLTSLSVKPGEFFYTARKLNAFSIKRDEKNKDFGFVGTIETPCGGSQQFMAAMTPDDSDEFVFKCTSAQIFDERDKRFKIPMGGRYYHKLTDEKLRKAIRDSQKLAQGGADYDSHFREWAYKRTPVEKITIYLPPR